MNHPDFTQIRRDIDEAITFATLSAFKPVVEGEMIATVKLIPFGVEAQLRDAAVAAADIGGDQPGGGGDHAVAQDQIKGGHGVPVVGSASSVTTSQMRRVLVRRYSWMIRSRNPAMARHGMPG